MAKSGTSALLYKIANSLPRGETEVLFELPRCPGCSASNVVAKVLLDGYLWSLDATHRHTVEPTTVDIDSYAGFDKRILIVRDPRDRLISQALYVFFGEPYCRDELFVQSALRFLRQKEADPAAVRFMDFVAMLRDYPTHAGKLTARLPQWAPGEINAADIVDNRLVAYCRARPDLFLVYYEDLVDGNLDPLEAYLDIPLPAPADVDLSVKRVERTKSYGNYRNWFTDDDHACFTPLLAEFTGYFSRYRDRPRSGRPGDESPGRNAVLRPEHGSGYVLRIVNEARAGLHLPPLDASAME